MAKGDRREKELDKPPRIEKTDSTKRATSDKTDSNKRSSSDKMDSNKKSPGGSGSRKSDSGNDKVSEILAVPHESINETSVINSSEKDEKDKVSKINKDITTKDDSGKADARELRKLREKCHSLSERNSFLESLQEKHQELLKSYSLLESQLKDVQGQCICKENPSEVLDDESVDSQIEQNVKELDDDILKASLLRLIRKQKITEKSYQYVQQQLDEAKKLINESEKERVKKKDDDKAVEDKIENTLINGNVILKATLGKADSVFNKISRKVTKDDMKSFVSNLSDKNTDSVMSITSAMLQENESFLNTIEPKMKCAIKKSVEEELPFTREAKSQNEFPHFPNQSHLHNKNATKRQFSSEKKDFYFDGSVRAKRSRGGGRGSAGRGRPWERGLVRGPYRGHVNQYRGSHYRPIPSTHDDTPVAAKTFTFSNKIRSDILEIPGQF